MINNWPYSDLHELNLDWLISKVKALDTKVNEDLDTYINNYIEAHLSDFTVSANYDEDTETIVYTNGTHAVSTLGDAIRFAIDEVFVDIKDSTARNDISTINTDIGNIQGDITTLQGQTAAIGTTARDLLFPVGSYYVTPTNVAPAFGGTWTLVDKQFSEVHGTLVAGGTEYTAGDDVTIDSVAIRRVDRTIELRVTCSAGTFGEATTNLLSLNNAAARVGLSNFPSTSVTMFSDVGNVLLAVECTGAGTIRVVDAFVIASTISHTYTGGLSAIDITLVASNMNEMLDSACDKFTWQRTA